MLPMWNCCQYQCCQFSIGNWYWNWQHWQQWQHSSPLPRQSKTTGGASSAACRLESRITRLESPLRRFSLSLPPPPNGSAQTRATRHPGALPVNALEGWCHGEFISSFGRILYQKSHPLCGNFGAKFKNLLHEPHSEEVGGQLVIGIGNNGNNGNIQRTIS